MMDIKQGILITIILLGLIVSGCIEQSKKNPMNTTDPYDTIDDDEQKKMILVETTNLQQTLDTIENNSVVIIKSGIIDQTIFVNTTVELTGEQGQNTVFRVTDALVNPAIVINAESCQISNMTIINEITDTADDNAYSIGIDARASFLTVDLVSLQGFHNGLKIRFQQRNVIKNSNIINASTGIEIWDAHRNQIKNCTISNCEQFGVFIGFDATYNQVSFCTITNCDNGVRIKGASDNSVFRNTFISCRNPFYECCGAQDNVFNMNTEQ